MIRWLKRLLCVALACMVASPAFAYLEQKDASGNTLGAMVLYWLNGGVATPVAPATGMPTADTNGAAFQGAVVVTPGTPFAAGRSLGVVCPNTGSLVLTLNNGSTINMPIQGSSAFQYLPFAVTNVAAGTEASACTIENLI